MAQGPASIQTKTPTTPARKDPRPRPVDGVAGWFRIKAESRDPNKFYCWVDVATGAVDQYASMGYEPVKWAGPHQGVQIVGGNLTRKPGEDILCRGQLLMQISLEAKHQLEAEGEFGETGQKELDRIEKLIIRRRGNKDYFRGIGGIEGSLPNGQFMDVENEISPAFGVSVL